MSSPLLLILNGAILTVCAVSDFAFRTECLIGLMLFLPLLDKNWARPDLKLKSFNFVCWGIIAITGGTLLLFNQNYTVAAINTLAFAALPEEWFFRAYLMTQLNKVNTGVFFLTFKINNSQRSFLLTNTIASSLFALLHTHTQGWFGLMVFFPSLFYGWVYQRSKDLVLVILLHGLSNIVFFIYFSEFMKI